MVFIVRKKVKGVYYLHVHSMKYVGSIGREGSLTQKKLKIKLKKFGIPYSHYLKKMEAVKHAN